MIFASGKSQRRRIRFAAGPLTWLVTGARTAARPLASGGTVRWRTRVVSGESSYCFVQKLTGVLVRCPKCGQVACSLYRKQYLANGGDLLLREDGGDLGGEHLGPGYYLKCRSCHQKSYPRTQPNFVRLLRDALPPSDMREILDHRRSAPSPSPYTVKPYDPFPRPAHTKAALIAGLVILLIIAGGAAYLLLTNHSGGWAPFF